MSLIDSPCSLIADARGLIPQGDICDDFIRLRKALGGLKAVAGAPGSGVPFAIKSAKILMNKFRKACDYYNLLCYPVAVQSQFVVAAKGGFIHAVYTIRFVSLTDNSFIDVVCNSLGGDNQDKAAGKATTYGWKYAVLYSMLLPDGDVKEEWDDMVDTDDDFEPTAEPEGITKPVLSDYVARCCLANSIDEFKAIVAEARARFTAAELKSVTNTLMDKFTSLQEAQVVAEAASIKKESEPMT